MKTENNHLSSSIPHRRYPSLSDDFGRETAEPKKSSIFTDAPERDAGFRRFYLRLIVAVTALMIVAALVANA
jgi:hypothetical protein